MPNKHPHSYTQELTYTHLKVLKGSNSFKIPKHSQSWVIVIDLVSTPQHQFTLLGKIHSAIQIFSILLSSIKKC